MIPAKPFVQVPKALLKRKGLSATTKLVYGCIVDRMNDDGEAWAGIRKIAADVGCQPCTVLDSIARLETEGLLQVTRRPSGRSSIYRLPPGQPEGARKTKALGKPGRSENHKRGDRRTRTEALGKPEPNETDPLNKTQGKRARGDSRNVIWDVVCDMFSLHPVTEDDRKRVGKVVRNLKAKGATPDEIKIRVNRYRERWPRVASTPEAVVKHWDEFSQDQPHGDHSANAARVAAPAGKYAGIG